MLTETSVWAFDRRAIFVDVEAYEAAGGTMSRDLFQGYDGGCLNDPALLDRMDSERLQTEAEAFPPRKRRSRGQGTSSRLIIVSTSPSIRAMSDLKMNIGKMQTSAAVNIWQKTGRGVTPPYPETATRKASVRVL